MSLLTTRTVEPADWVFLGTNLQVPPEELQKTIPSLAVLVCPDGTRVVREGDPGVDVFIVGKGTLAVRRSTILLFGKEVARLTPGDLFGEVGFFAQRGRTASVVSVGPSEVYRILAAEMRVFLALHPALRMRLEDLARERLQKTSQAVNF